MQIFDAFVLGLIQGVTEFLPISSSAHLTLARTIFGLDTNASLGFDAMLHVASALAVIVFFSADLWILAQAVLRKLGRLPVNERDLSLFSALILAAVPALVAGLLVEIFFRKDLQSIGLMAILMLASAIFMMFVEWRYLGKGEHNEHVEPRNGFVIGLFQLLALLPGFSRTGSAVAGGMFLGISRYEAVRFSFLLSIPVLLGYGVHGFLELLKSGTTFNQTAFAVGGAAAFVSSLFAIRFFLNFIMNKTLWPFIWYTVVFAALAGYVSLIS
jgi:undecaprenyl-diphosphatase